MFSNQSAELSLNAPCKCVAAVTADRLESRFLVGTCSIQENDSDDHNNNNNHLHVVRYHSDVNDVGVDASLAHPTGPIQHLCPNPHDKTLVLTLPEQSSSATLYKIPASVMEMTNDLQSTADDTNTATTDYYNNNNQYHHPYGMGATSDHMHHSYNDSARLSESSISVQSSSSTSHPVLEYKLTLETSQDNNNNNNSRMVDMAWRDTSEHDDTATPGDVLTLDETGTVIQWDVSLGMAESMKTMEVAASSQQPLPAIACPRVAWDPHHAHSFAVSWGRSVKVMDSRSNAVETTIPRAHRYGVTDMDYNPNKPHVLATSGHDGLVHFFDIRSTHRPLLTARGGHSHYAWRVQYNPFHDQLVLSTGTDAVVNLWRVSTISSAPLLTLEDEDGGGTGGDMGGGDGGRRSETDAPNVRVARHEAGDAVYGAAWGAADAWLYMTVAYDGKVALHHVPSKEKYKILL